ncbi:hypothetical protein HK097_007248 [Rhizophlyctis rosea]|uniref:WD repeat-containing protein 55 homolog n=1 Tax=Rhizophlyctis rosea TaxID=64517 RepID=A0AAD5SBW7_9FUNG|nr:hypothetical protein HK097_007248 [Rhizophlyctis rosea]
MAMEYRNKVLDTHPKPVLCVQCGPKLVYTAGEEAVIRVWENESGNPHSVLTQHVGWIMGLLYCAEHKILFSCAVDGMLIAWGQAGKILQKIQTNSPIYSLAYNSRRQQLMVGHNRCVRVFTFLENLGNTNPLNTNILEAKSVTCHEHTDVVSCIVSAEGRFYSAGYDRKIMIYDIPHHGDLKLRVAHVISNAHDAAISCMVYGKDQDNSWLITGSFDRMVKLWSLDGNLLQRFDGFRSMVIWRYNQMASVTVLPGHADVVECLTFTSKEPLLIFSGGDDGIIKKWERLQLNTFMYSEETLILPNPEPTTPPPVQTTLTRDPTLRRKQQSLLHKRISEKLDTWKRFMEDDTERQQQVALMSGSAVKAFQRKQQQLEAPKQRRRSLDVIDGGGSGRGVGGMAVASKPVSRPGVVSLCYYEDLDLLVSGYEDSKIHVWGYNEETVKYVGDVDLRDKEILDANGGVSNRVAGMTLKASLLGHTEAVTAITCFERDGMHWLVSTGWDRRICIWDLKGARLQDVFRGGFPIGGGREELAADGIILDIEYCAERNEIAYASADKLAYVRRFSPKGDEMVLLAVLQGHEAEVTQVRWNQKYSQWITGSEDRTIRVWPSTGIPCLRIINNDGPITALCIDSINGCIISGSQDKIIRVIDPEKKDEVVQKNVGHLDEIRSIVHIPARGQYVSASWDNTVRIWNAYTKKGQRRIGVKNFVE